MYPRPKGKCPVCAIRHPRFPMKCFMNWGTLNLHDDFYMYLQLNFPQYARKLLDRL